MVDEIGKIEKPEAEQFIAGKKIYVVPLVFKSKESPLEYVAKIGLYWSQVKEHINKLEEKIGKTKHIYHEAVAAGGEEGIKLLEEFNPDVCELIKGRCQAGAVLEAAEDKALLDECLDWERFIMMGFMSEKVAEQVSRSYREATEKRYAHFIQSIEKTLKAGEAGIVFIREGNWLQFPKDIEIFSVTPPALDEVHRWLREKSKEMEKDAAKPPAEGK